MAYATQRRYIIILAQFFLIIFWGQGDASPLEVFLQAHEAYKQGAIDQACDLWGSLSPKTDRIYFNLARCMQKKGDLDRAHFYLRTARALSSASFLPVIDQAIDQLQSHTPSFAERSLRLIEKVSRLSALGFWQVLLVLMCAILLVSFYHSFAWWVQILIVIGITFVAACAIVRDRQLTIMPGMIMQNDSCISILPRADVDCVARLMAGQQVEILQKRDRWYKIRHQDTVGWVDDQVLCHE